MATMPMTPSVPLETGDKVVEVPASVRISERDYQRVIATKQDFNQVASYLVEQYSKGGVMLKAAHAKYLEQVSGIPCKTPESVMAIVENGINRRSASGHLVVNYAVDPAFADPLEQLAKAQGRNVDEIVQEACAIVFTNSWLYALNISGGTIHLSKEMREELEQAVGKKMITGQDLVDWSKRAADSKEATEPKETSDARRNGKIGKVLATVREKLDALHQEA